MTGWSDLHAALDGAAERGEAIRFWWRDDDAGRADPALSRLLALAERQEAPLSLAVVAGWLDDAAQGCIAASDGISVLQHGWTHRNAAPPGAKAVELGHRPAGVILEELGRGRAVLEDAFGSVFLAALVPPWNRIDPALHGVLNDAGYVGLSTFGVRPKAEAARGVRSVNTHLDPVDWRGSRLFVGSDRALRKLLDTIDVADEPIGVLTHHLVMDEAGWTFLDRLLDELRHHPGARLCSAHELFGESG